MKGKPCVIVGCYPGNERSSHVLNSCLISIWKATDLKVFVSTHTLPAVPLNYSYDYYLTDFENTDIECSELLDILTPWSSHVYLNIGDHFYRSQLNMFVQHSSHHYAAFLNMKNAALFARSLGYKNAFFTEGDNVFVKEELEQFLKMSNDCENAMFVKGHSLAVDGLSVLCCRFDLDFFLDHEFGKKSLKDVELEDWLEISKKIGNPTVEKVFAHVFTDSDIVQSKNIDDNLKFLFPKSDMNILGTIDTETVLANFGTPWTSDFSSEQIIHIYRSPEPTTEVISTIEARRYPGGGTKKFVIEKSGKGHKITDVEFDFEDDDKMTFTNDISHFGGMKTRQSFDLKGSEFRKYLKLNTVQYDWKKD